MIALLIRLLPWMRRWSYPVDLACSDASAYVYAFPLLYLSVLDSYCLSHNAIVHIALTPTLQNNNTISLIIFPNYHLYNPYLMSA